MRRTAPISRSSYNMNDYYIHTTWNGYRHRYYVLTEDVVFESEFDKYVLVECESYEKCKEWIKEDIERRNRK